MARKPSPRSRSGLRHGEGYLTEYRRPDGSTRVQARWYEYQPDGTRRQRAKSFTHHDRHAALDAAEDHLRQVARDRRDGRRQGVAEITVSGWVAQYIDRGASRWRGATVATYRQRHRAHIAESLGPVRLVDLDPLRVQRWVDGMVYRGLSPALVHSAVHLLGGALGEAVKLGVIPANPVRGVTLPSTKTEYVGQTWTESDVQRVLREIGDDPYWGALYRLILTTGMRPGELRALTWDDVDLRAGQVTIRSTITKGPDGRETVGTTTKGGRTRVVSLRPAVTAALATLRRTSTGNPYIFGRGEGWLRPNAWSNKHARLCARAGVPLIRLHDLRHTYATIQLGHGVNPRIVQVVIGHKSVQETLDTYSHVSLRHQEDAGAHLDTLLGGDDVVVKAQKLPLARRIARQRGRKREKRPV